MRRVSPARVDQARPHTYLVSAPRLELLSGLPVKVHKIDSLISIGASEGIRLKDCNWIVVGISRRNFADFFLLHVIVQDSAIFI